MRLHVHVLGSKDLLGAFDGEAFNRIDMLASAVIAFAGIPFGILIRHHAALGGQDRGAGEIFRSDQQQFVTLPLLLGDDGLVGLGVG